MTLAVTSKGWLLEESFDETVKHRVRTVRAAFEFRMKLAG